MRAEDIEVMVVLFSVVGREEMCAVILGGKGKYSASLDGLVLE